MTHTYRVHQFHLVWSTKNRQNWIEKSYQNRLYDYIGGIIKEHRGILLEIGGIANHVHLLISLSNLDHYSGLIRDVKAGSSRWVHKMIPASREFEWQEGYGSFGVQFANIESVKRYIQNQEEHHRNRTFEEEYVDFLNMHNISYDPRYILG
ncbi:MAG: IS200/IS605 family transposase [Parachlamydiaceae bacterium]|nr:IS200/IS605 family transposase [Parachlamydiaceae bacterium]